MTTTAILMRHGKYSTLAGELSWNGKQQAESTAKKLIEAGIQPDAILYSPATRAEETAKIVAETFKAAGKQVGTVRLDENLDCDSGNILTTLSKLNGVRTVLAVSHEPVIEEAVRDLTGRYFSPEYGHAVVIQSASNDWRDTVQSCTNKITEQFVP